MQALAKDPAQRPTSMQAVITALRTVDFTVPSELTASTIVLNPQQSLDSQIEKKPKTSAKVRPPDAQQEKKQRGAQLNFKWLGFVLSVTLAGVVAFALLPKTK